MWDLLFVGLRSRDESIVSTLLRWLFQLILNFTIGLVGALVAFVYYLWDLVTSYQPDKLTAVAFFMLASITAASLVASYLAAMYAAAAGTVYVAAKAAANLQLQNGANGGARRQNIRYQQQQQRGRNY